MLTEHGNEISRVEAQSLIDNQVKIADNNRLLLAADCKSRGEATASVYYYADAKGQPGNC